MKVLDRLFGPPWVIVPGLFSYLKTINHNLEKIMSTQAEAAAALAALAAQVDKAKAEVLAKIAELQAAADAAGAVTPELQAAIDAVGVAAQGIDDVVPDAV